MTKNLVEIRDIGDDYIIIQRNDKGSILRIIGKMKGKEPENLLTLIK